MSLRVTRTALLLLLLLGLVRAGGHFIRLAILAALGLAGMYMLHKLAQDYNKIQGSRPGRPGGAVAGATRAVLKAVFKRDVSDRDLEWELDNLADDATLESVLSEDPKGCARKMVCQLAARGPAGLKHDEASILRYIRKSSSGFLSTLAPAEREFRRAYTLGLTSRDTKECAEEYKKCPFDSRTIMKLLMLH